MNEKLKRCGWAGDDPRYVAYHDEEWGVPLHDDQQLFEFLILEGAQAGLSWSTILYKRDNYREAFSGFDPALVAKFNKRKIESLLKNPGIVRNRLKVESAVNNAKLYLSVQDEFGSFNGFMWEFVSGKPKQNRWRSMKNVPASTAISDAFSKELKKRGFKFVGSTICYAFMQATGMVNDHVTTCFRHKQVAKLK
ncbi:MAG: DNA-3-methyladenine glycosylase I [Gammaproteobacteria bacterium]|nr:DNA-3-methyladenine glycosylase I [Gammaproteobacteria bacterium]